MFGVGTGEIILILAIAMLVVGPERMVSFARQLGAWIAKFRQETDSVTAEFREALSLDLEEIEAEGTPAANPSPEPESAQGTRAAAPSAQQAQAEAQGAEAAAADRPALKISPFADSELGESAWPVGETPIAAPPEVETDGEVIAIEVAHVGANADDLEPTPIQVAQVIVDEGDPEPSGSDGEDKG